MTPKQRETIRGGKRLQQQRMERKNQKPTSSGKREMPERKGSKRRLFQMVVSGTILVIVIGIKLLSPQTMERYRDDVLQLMGEKTDFAAVFSAVGETIGKDTVSHAFDKAYKAVFGSDEITVEDTKEKKNDATEQASEKKTSEKKASEEKAQKAEENDSQKTADPIVYTEENLPDKVELFQQVLNFSYTNPVKGSISSKFGLRDHPITGDNRFHYGLDIAAEAGTTIDSFASGIVTAVGDSSDLGKYVTIAHANDYVTLYAHCSKIMASSGQQVKMGDPIAEVGDTGDTTGPHLHFELHKNSVYLNPVYYVTY